MGCGGSKDAAAEAATPPPKQYPTAAARPGQVALKEETPKLKTANAKRKGVSAEAGGGAPSSSNYTKVVHEKSDEARQMIANATSESTLFAGLTDAQREDVVAA